MNIIVVAVVATLVFGAPQGIILSLAAAVIAALVRSRGALHERA
jgi:ABC-type proline/glycine betaine transport system permease subunit